MSETDETKSESWGRETLESMLGVIAYICYSKIRANPNAKNSAIFKGFNNRSAGPLWGLLKECSTDLKDEDEFSKGVIDLTEIHNELLQQAVTKINQDKHGKESKGLNYQQILVSIGNVLHKMFGNSLLGYFEDIKLKRFSSGEYSGLFRGIQGPSGPFPNVFYYEGKENPTPGYVYLVCQQKETALNLSPLIISGLTLLPGHAGPEIHFYDTCNNTNEIFGFKAVQKSDEVKISSDEFSSIFKEIFPMREYDQSNQILQGIKLQKRNLEP